MMRSIRINNRKGFLGILVILFCFIVFVLATTGCQKKELGDLPARLAELDDPSMPPPPERVREYQKKISQLEKQSEAQIKRIQDQGTFYELIGLKYLDYQMYGPAYDSFDQALMIYPEKATLHYNRGLSSGWLAASRNNDEEKQEDLVRAELDYRKAIALDSRYSDPLYALAVLLVFDLDRPEEAGPLLDRFLEFQKSHENALYLRARLYEQAGNNREALSYYKECARVAKNKELKEEALQRASMVQNN